jgi:UDP-N-acetylmuramate--alanine ligase
MKPLDASSAREALAKPVSCVHMTGIGGVGMAGLALLLAKTGREVSGCDVSGNTLTRWLEGEGITCRIGHDPAHLDAMRPDFIVRSPAVSRDEPELREAIARGLPVMNRGAVLSAWLRERRTAAVAGTHGKTTTASMLAWILEVAGMQPSFCIGGVGPNLGAVAKLGHGPHTVVEADESDGTLALYHPEIAVVTSMDWDHVDFYRDEESQRAVYLQFAAQSAHVVLPVEERVELDGVGLDTFGFAPEAGVRADAVELSAEGSRFDLLLDGRRAGTMELGVSGAHNIRNALAAIAAARMWNAPLEAVAEALRTFRLPARRFELVSCCNGVCVAGDYAHHPVEIDALLAQARLLEPRRILAVFQPHRYSRTLAFKKEFARSLATLDAVALAPVYAASEPPVEGGHAKDLFAVMRTDMGERVKLATSLEDAWSRVRHEARAGDLLLVIGAGDVENIVAWAREAWGVEDKVSS